MQLGYLMLRYNAEENHNCDETHKNDKYRKTHNDNNYKKTQSNDNSNTAQKAGNNDRGSGFDNAQRSLNPQTYTGVSQCGELPEERENLHFGGCDRHTPKSVNITKPNVSRYARVMMIRMPYNQNRNAEIAVEKSLMLSLLALEDVKAVIDLLPLSVD